MSKIVVVIEGGCVQTVICEDNYAEVMVIDYDTEGQEEGKDGVVMVDQGEGKECPAHVYELIPEFSDTTAQKLWDGPLKEANDQ